MNDAEGREWLRARIRASIAVKEAVLDGEPLLIQLSRVCRRIAAALAGRRRVLVFGNGGSAADAQHIAAELVGKFYRNHDPLPALALTTNASVLTAVGNDFEFGAVFARQIQAYGAEGDVALAISTSGTSPNVVRAVEEARRIGLYTVALTGASGGHLLTVADECLCVPSADVPRIQEVHTLFGHLICEWVEVMLTESDLPVP